MWLLLLLLPTYLLSDQEGIPFYCRCNSASVGGQRNRTNVTGVCLYWQKEKRVLQIGLRTNWYSLSLIAIAWTLPKLRVKGRRELRLNRFFIFFFLILLFFPWWSVWKWCLVFSTCFTLGILAYNQLPCWEDIGSENKPFVIRVHLTANADVGWYESGKGPPNAGPHTHKGLPPPPSRLGPGLCSFIFTGVGGPTVKPRDQ